MVLSTTTTTTPAADLVWQPPEGQLGQQRRLLHQLLRIKAQCGQWALCCPSPTRGQVRCLDTASIVVHPCGTYLIQIYDSDLLYVAKCKVCLKHYNLGSLSRELMSIIRPYVDHKPGESLSLSASELVHCLSRVGVRGACIHHMWRGLSVKPPGLLEGP